MTETTATATPPGATRTLYRDPEAGKLAGVCEGLARYTDTDPVIWRIATVVLAVVGGGTGVVLYLLGWLLLPKLGSDGSLVQSALGRRSQSLRPKSLAVLAILALLVLVVVHNGRGMAAVAVLSVVAYLVYRDRQSPPVAPSYEPSDMTHAQPPAWTAAPPMVRVPRERSRLGLVTFSLAALVTGGLVWAALAGADGLTAGRITAVALAVVAGGLIVGTWYGRGRWLIAVGLLLCLGLGATIAADATGGTLRGGVGQRTWVVGEGRTSQSFALGIGEATLDLTNLPSNGSHVVVKSRVGLGHLVVIVPNDVPIRLHAKLRIGEITEFGSSLVNGNHRMERTRSYGPAGDPLVEVDATLGTGQIEVRHG